MALDLDYYQKFLEEEKQKLEEQLGTVAHRNPDAPQDWEPTYPAPSADSPAPDEAADQEEEFENEVGVELSLESRLRDINDALEKIKHGNFGICAVGKEEIDEARLKANPAARTCMKHAEGM
ncbi:MAG: TraR/DksA C4-type zinc finger protein [Patescibacteria group bacterium]